MLHNTHAFFQRAITAMPWYRDLALEQSASYIEPELNVALITRDGGALEWWTDISRTIASFEAFSPRDAEDLAALARRLRADRADPRAGRPSPPLPPAERQALLEKSAAGRRLLGGQPALAAGIRAPGIRASGP